MALGDAPRRSAPTSTSLADHGLAGLGFGTGLRAREACRRRWSRRPTERDFPLFEIPYETPFIAVTEKAFTRLVNEQYAVLQRSIAAQERLQRIVLSERGLDAIAGALASLVGGTRAVFDGRGEPLAQRTFRRELDAGVVEELGAELRERARRGDGRGFAPAHGDLAPRALALPVAGAERDGMPQAWLVAAKDAGGAGGVRPPDPAPGGDRRRARAAAPPRRRRRPSAAWRATCWRP